MRRLQEAPKGEPTEYDIYPKELPERHGKYRFEVGEVTRTDVAQAQSSLAQARSDFYTAQANLQNSIANYRQIIGVEPRRTSRPYYYRLQYCLVASRSKVAGND